MSDFDTWNNWTDGERMLQWIGQKERADSLAKELREVDAALGDYTVNIIRSLPEAAAKLRARVDELEGKVTAIVGWLEREQPDVFRRGLWDALREVPSAGAGL